MTRNEAELAYLRKHKDVLEAEIEDLKNKNAVIEMQLIGYKDSDRMSLKMLRKLLTDAIVSKRTYQNMMKDLKTKIKTVNELLMELREIKPQYEKELNKTLKEITKAAK